MFPVDAKRSAFVVLMPSDKAATNAISEEKGKIVAAKKAEKNKTNSAIEYSR